MSILKRHESLGWLVAVLAEKMKGELGRRLQAHGLGIGDWPTLFALWEHEGLTQTELAERCRTAHYTTTRALDRLTELGMVERRDHPNSRRAYLIYLTAKGRELQPDLIAEARSVNQMILSKLDTPQEKALMQILQQLIS